MKISYKDVEQQCNEIHGVATNINSIFDEIKDITNTIKSNDFWGVEAATAYGDKLGTVTSEFDEISKEIDASILFIARSTDGYQNIDETILREICSNLNITDLN